MCNLNPYKKESVVSFTDLDLMLNNFVLASTNPAAVDNATWGFAGLEPIVYRSRALHAMALIGSELSPDDLNDTTYSMDDFIISCAYNSKYCNKDLDFKLMYDSIYGACYQFNTKATYKSTRAGPLYGLRVLMKVNQSEYLDVSRSAGVRVTVHGHDEEPFPDAFGLTAAPGFTTSFGVKFVRTERKSEPYGNCTHQTPSDLSYYYSTTYSTEGCFRSCIQDAMIARCRCADPRYPVPAAAFACTTVDLECVSEFYANSGSGRRFNTVRDCVCPQPCLEASYGVTVSTASWPSEVYTPPECDGASNSWGDAASCHDWYAENTLFVEIFYERMNYQLLRENEAYGIVNLISDMGGQLGLWMGVSVISVVEFISLLILLCVYCIARKNGQQRDLDDDSDIEDDSDDDDTKTPAPPSDDLYDSSSHVEPPTIH